MRSDVGSRSSSVPRRWHLGAFLLLSIREVEAPHTASVGGQRDERRVLGPETQEAVVPLLVREPDEPAAVRIHDGRVLAARAWTVYLLVRQCFEHSAQLCSVKTRQRSDNAEVGERNNKVTSLFPELLELPDNFLSDVPSKHEQVVGSGLDDSRGGDDWNVLARRI